MRAVRWIAIAIAVLAAAWALVAFPGADESGGSVVAQKSGRGCSGYLWWRATENPIVNKYVIVSSVSGRYCWRKGRITGWSPPYARGRATNTGFVLGWRFTDFGIPGGPSCFSGCRGMVLKRQFNYKLCPPKIGWPCVHKSHKIKVWAYPGGYSTDGTEGGGGGGGGGGW